MKVNRHQVRRGAVPLLTAAWLVVAVAALPVLGQQVDDAQAAEAFVEFDRALRQGDLERTRQLLESNPSFLDRPDRFGRTPLYNVIHAGKKEIIDLLLEKGAVATKANADGDTPLHRAAQSNDVATMKLLFARNAFVDVRNQRGETPLSKAAAQGAVAAAEFLIAARGAVVNRADAAGNTPLHHAALRGHQAMVALLLRYRADTAAKNAEDKQPVDVARTAEIRALMQKQ